MPINMDNLRRWSDEVDIDYFTQFIKAWIPFNAWYRHTYGQDGSEREIMNAIKADGNVIQSRIVQLLAESGQDADTFRGHVSTLHNRLEGHAIQSHNARITFTNVFIGSNPANVVNEQYSGLTYHVERGTAAVTGTQVLVEILSRAGTAAFRKLQPRYDLDDLRGDPSFAALSNVQKSNLQARYQRVNPRLEVDLLDTSSGSMQVGSYAFTSDRGRVFAGLVEVLYLTRCVLFHGEVVPTREINAIYEPAYHILRRFIQSIV